jgi:hypothetical protein
VQVSDPQAVAEETSADEVHERRGPVPKILRKWFRARRPTEQGDDDAESQDPHPPEVLAAHEPEGDVIPLVSDEELDQSIAMAPTALCKKDIGRRERIATAVLSVMIRLNRKYSRSMVKQAVAIADELSGELDATAWDESDVSRRV